MGEVAQYHIKPPIAPTIEAMQWDGTEENAKQIISWFEKFRAPNEAISYISQGDINTDVFYIMIKSGHLSMTACKGDYIVWSAKSRSEAKKFSVHRKEAFEAGHYKVGSKPTPTSDQALESLRLKLTGV